MSRLDDPTPPVAGAGPGASETTAAAGPDGTHRGSVRYRGRSLTGRKGFWEGTQRTVPPDETFELVRPFFATAGITRVANVTGLDRIGIPVTLVFRPNSKSLTTSSGKGVSLSAALTSGVMEGIELFHAEEARLNDFRATYAELGAARPRREHLPLTRYNLFTPQLPLHWTPGWDLIGQTEVAVPSAAIDMDPRSRRRADLHTFQLTSNGLASGNCLLEAINAGLFEVIERDAVTCRRLVWKHHNTAPPVVDLATVVDPTVVELLDRLTFAGIRTMVFDCTVDTDVPVYMAYLHDAHPQDSLGTYRGYGCHLDPAVAMSRAITEAVQGRLNYIAGSRDDVFRHSYAPFQRFARPDTLFDRLVPSVDATDRVSAATPTFDGDTAIALDRLRAAGLEQAVVVDLSRPEFPIAVVKVMVPGLEGYLLDFVQPGPRATAFLEVR